MARLRKIEISNDTAGVVVPLSWLNGLVEEVREIKTNLEKIGVSESYEYLTYREAVKKYKTCYITLRKLIESGQIEYIEIGRSKRLKIKRTLFPEREK